MSHLLGTDRAQLLLLPEAVDDYVGPDNPVRFIEAFVDGLDLAAAGFVRVVAKEQFRYYPDKDIYLCPADQVLSPRHFGKSRDNVKIDYVNRNACKACSLRESVEHPSGTIKQWMYQAAFLMRRLENVRGEFSLTALAFNIKRAIILVGVAGLIAAVRV